MLFQLIFMPRKIVCSIVERIETSGIQRGLIPLHIAVSTQRAPFKKRYFMQSREEPFLHIGYYGTRNTRQEEGHGTRNQLKI